MICKEDVSVYYTFFTLRGLGQQIKEWGSKGSVGSNMNKTEFAALEVIQPLTNIMLEFDENIKELFNNIKLHQKELILLNKLQELINAKMSQATLQN